MKYASEGFIWSFQDLPDERKEKTEERLRKLEEWEINHWGEINIITNAKMDIFRSKAQELEHEQERKRARSARRAAKHARPRNREKIKIPAPPG